MKPLDQSAIRKQNVRKILDLLTFQSPRTRQSLAEATGLSLMTVTNLVDQLKEQDVLEILPAKRMDAEKRCSGRKAENIYLRGTQHAWLIVDLSGKRFRFTLLGFDLSILMEKSDTACGDYLPRLYAFLHAMKSDVGNALRKRALLGVSIVTPGPYEISSDTVSNQRLPELNSIRIKEEFRLHFGEYDYYVDEDVKFAVRAFSSLIEQQQCELLYYLYIGEGVGGASVHSGDMLRGLNATSGDAGQLTDPSGATYESRLSLSAFSELLGCPPAGDRRLSDLLKQCAQDNPTGYQQALEQIAGIVSDMLYSVLWVLDPSHIIIDCRYAAPFEDMFIHCISARLDKRFAPSGRMIPVIAAAPQGMSSVVRGAVQVLQREWVERILT